MAALKASGRPWTLNKGEGAFYGPKLEYVLRDAISAASALSYTASSPMRLSGRSENLMRTSSKPKSA